MKCPNCGEEISYVYRFLVEEVGVAHPISDHGIVDIESNPDPKPDDDIREYDDGAIPVWFECPLCHDEIDATEKESLHCSHCLHEVSREDAIFCCGYDEDDPDGCRVVACGDCAGLLFDDYQCCQDCHNDENDEE
jgi:hypothetical protein